MRVSQTVLNCFKSSSLSIVVGVALENTGADDEWDARRLDVLESVSQMCVALNCLNAQTLQRATAVVHG